MPNKVPPEETDDKNLEEEQDNQPVKKRGKKNEKKKSEEDNVSNVKAESPPPEDEQEKQPVKKRGRKDKKPLEDDTTNVGNEEKDENEQEKQPPSKRKANKKKSSEAKEGENNEDVGDPPEGEEAQDKKTKGKKGAKKKSKLNHPRTVDMIIEALENLEDAKGSSVQAIKAYILENYKVRDDMIKSMMKRALVTAVKDNLLVRPAGQTETQQVLCGRYLIRRKRPDEIEAPKPRPPSLRQLNVPKSKKSKTKKGKKRKKSRKGFY